MIYTREEISRVLVKAYDTEAQYSTRLEAALDVIRMLRNNRNEQEHVIRKLREITNLLAKTIDTI